MSRIQAADSVSGMDTDLGSLLERVAGGDRQAFARLYDHASARLTASSPASFRGAACRGCLAGDVHPHLAEGGNLYASIASPMAWMATIAHIRAIDVKRRFAERLAQRSEELDPETADGAPDPLTLAEQADAFRRLKACRQAARRTASRWCCLPITRVGAGRSWRPASSGR